MRTPYTINWCRGGEGALIRGGAHLIFLLSGGALIRGGAHSREGAHSRKYGKYYYDSYLFSTIIQTIAFVREFSV